MRSTSSAGGGGRARVLYLNSDAAPNPYFEVVASQIDRDRFDLRLASLGPAGQLQRDAARWGLSSFAVGATCRRDYGRAAVRLARRLRQNRIEVVHTHLLDASLVGLLAARLARIPVGVMTAHHCHEIPLHDRWALTAVDRLCARTLAHGVIAPSRQMADTLVSVHRVPGRKVEVIHHGFPVERFDPTTVEGKALRAELGLDGRLVLGCLGRLYWIKNYEALLRAFAPIAAERPDAVLVIAGGGDSAPLLSLGSALGIAHQIMVLPRRDDVPELLAAMDLFVHPALAESFGMVIVEAMAMAKPILSTPVGIAPDVVIDAETGVLARDGTVSGLQCALDEALALRDRWHEMGAESRRRVEEFRGSRMVRDYEQYYLKMLSQGAR